MTKRAMLVFSLSLIAVGLAVAVPAGAQTGAENYVVDVASPTTPTGAAGSDKVGIHLGGFFIPPPPFDTKVVWRDSWICRFSGPAEVTGFRVQCPAASFLDFHIADCCLSGDHPQLKGKAWDGNPNTAVTTAPGPANQWGVAGRVYRYAGTPFNRGIDAFVECSYLHGVSVFLADAFVAFSSDGACTVTANPPVNHIDRAP